MKNNEKIDIKLEADASLNSEDMTEEERCQGYYETALRYINIATYMKQYEDQDKYYQKALQNLRKAKAGIPGLKPMIKDIVDKQSYARAQGIITMYEEASKIRDHARNSTDYYSAQTLFDRLHKYEAKHQVKEGSVTSELYARVCQCSDSEEQAKYCGEMAEKLMQQQKRKSRIFTVAFFAVVIAFLAFTRTTLSRKCLADLYSIAGKHESASHWYDYVYQKTGDSAVYEKYKESKYQAAIEASATTNREEIRDSFRELARLEYKDSQQYLVNLEKARIAELEDGEKIRFGEVNWRILTHDGNRVLLLKDKTQGDAPFQRSGGKVTWDSSSIRSWLNDTYINELFSFEAETDAILVTDVTAADNALYGTKGGASTQDKLFLLSADEFERYADLVPKTRNLWWLRTPGNSPGSMSFVSTDKTVMLYGYDTGSDNIKARPAIWVDTTVE